MSILRKGLAATTLTLLTIILATIFSFQLVHATEPTLLVPNTGQGIAIVATTSGCTIFITFVVSLTTLHFLRRRR